MRGVFRALVTALPEVDFLAELLAACAFLGAGFLGDGFAGIGPVMPGMFILCANAGADSHASAIPLAAA